MLKWIKDEKEIQKVTDEHADYFVLVFSGSFSDSAQRAIEELTKFSKDYKDIPLYALDVQKVKNVHQKYGVESVPTVLVIKKRQEANRFTGVESAAFYATQLAGMAPVHVARPTKKKALRVTVYTSPGCPPCGMVKKYLQENGIPYRSIDISRDERAAREIVRRSGQQAVPQIDINGRIVVGFDKGKLAGLLGITNKNERTET
ncbi:MAG: glutaredoxin [Lentisphaerae bacterium]|nr:glutaredoxin [Lentisphaerota bacterium]